jgi:energy-coupling factor transporter ATP-binding protein EcfA2
VPALSAAEVNGRIADWLGSRQAWLQEAAARLLTTGELSQTDIDDLVELLKTEAGQKVTPARSFPGFTPGSAESAVTSEELRLVSIGDVRGIENLAPRTPLSFGNGHLMVVYGRNGSGKSGYVRILKKACGKPHTSALKPNVFQPPPSDRGCSITYSLDGVPKTVLWKADAAPVEALRCVDIFDSSCGKVYLDTETEATYTPGAVTLFEQLAQACRLVGAALETEQRALVSQLPVLPDQFVHTIAGKKLSSLASQSQASLKGILSWSEADSKLLAQLEERLAADDSAALARQKRSIKRELDKLHGAILEACNSVSPEACERIGGLKRVALLRRGEAGAAAQATTGTAVLPGVGADAWRRLWEAARLYSGELAYPGLGFPNLDEDAHCVLCQQPLAAEARARLRDFDGHVRGRFETDARTAERTRDLAIEALPARPPEWTLQTECQAAGLQDDSWLQSIRAVWDAVEATVYKLSDLSTEVRPDGIDHTSFPVLRQLTTLSDTLAAEATQLEKDALQFDRAKAQADKLELQARQWTSQQATAISAEFNRLRTIAMYERWKSATNTASISKEAGVIAESLITAAYIERFNTELQSLGAKHIRVELVKTRTERGRAKHRIQLKGVAAEAVNPDDVLSEGEQRIVALAAFLADVTNKAQASPFVFDDPVSSLDQVYEERTASRLIELSRNRQVIVYTHRLSLLGLMEKGNPELVYLMLEGWGSGQPGQIPPFGINPVKVLRSLRNDRLAKATKASHTEGSDAYYPLGKSICSDFRVAMERIVESVLLGDVVQRHRREVHTKDKLLNLAKITADDCRLIEGLMTKYSCFEHSQSNETPVEIPAPDEIAADIDCILGWQEEFSKRKAPK